MGWIGIDLDGTLAHYESGDAANNEVGEPILPMLERVKMLMTSNEVRIFTARAYPINRHILGSMAESALNDLEDTYMEACKKESDRSRVRSAFRNVRAIRTWTRKHLGKQLTVTNLKDPLMKRLYDDRAVTVQQNTGMILTRKTR
jgi:hypothetical protein